MAKTLIGRHAGTGRIIPVKKAQELAHRGVVETVHRLPRKLWVAFSGDGEALIFPPTTTERQAQDFCKTKEDWESYAVPVLTPAKLRQALRKKK
jgi:hypothetical protein